MSKFERLSTIGLFAGFVFFLFVGHTTRDSPANAFQRDTKDPAGVLDNSIMGGADNPYMMPYYTGRVLPSPQKAEYKDKYLSLSKTAIVLNGIHSNDPRLKYLLQRIALYGGKYEIVKLGGTAHTCVITINDAALAPPKNPQGYIIQSNGKNISLKASDFQGLLWAISSLNQMIFVMDGEPVVRSLDVIDWPESLHRGFLAQAEISKDPEVIAHFMVAYKWNWVDFRGQIAGDKKHYNDWRLPRSSIFLNRVKEIGERLTPLGFMWYAGARFLGYDQIPQINCSSEADFDIIYNNFALPIAKAGGHLSVQFDDTRFPVHPDDLHKFGSAAKADYYLLTKLYEKLSSDYPEIRIAFTPPFYWGPVSPSHYPESRDDYLNMTGKLPAAIDVYWTGPRVRSDIVTKADVRWEIDRINRKPLIFQNAIGTPHDFDYHYMTDPLYSLKNWYYKGYLKDIKAYLLNGGDFNKSGALVSIAEWVWNPKKFEPEAIIKDAVMKLVGPEAYPVLKNMNSELSRFDTYLPYVTFRAIRNASALNDALNNLESLNESLKKINYKSIEFWTAADRSHLQRVRRFVNKVNGASQDPIVRRIIGRKDASVTMYFAVKDGAFDPDGKDLLIEPDDFTGGGVLIYGYSNAAAGILLEDRPTAYVTGKGTPTSEMSTTFELNTFPPSGDYQLILSGADDFLKEKCPIRITLNTKVLFEGPNPFSNKTWNTRIFELSADKLERNNVLTITNISPNGNVEAPPIFLLNYVVLHEK